MKSYKKITESIKSFHNKENNFHKQLLKTYYNSHILVTNITYKTSLYEIYRVIHYYKTLKVLLNRTKRVGGKTINNEVYLLLCN